MKLFPFLNKKSKKNDVACSPPKNFNIPKAGEFSPHIKIVSRNDAFDFIAQYRAAHVGDLTFLDVGGRHGEWKNVACNYNYSVLDLDPTASGTGLIVGDICSCSQIASETYDVVFSNNLLEHVREPWLAAEECVRITKVGGLLIHIAPFSWRYHPFPEDHYRFSHSGLAYLFERTKQVDTLMSGYDISKRRANSRGGKVIGNLDVPPIDELGGWRENWLTIYVAKKHVNV